MGETELDRIREGLATLDWAEVVGVKVDPQWRLLPGLENLIDGCRRQLQQKPAGRMRSVPIAARFPSGAPVGDVALFIEVDGKQHLCAPMTCLDLRLPVAFPYEPGPGGLSPFPALPTRA